MNLNTIEDLFFQIKSLKAELNKLPGIPETLLYRGHSNSNWNLSSTLERYTDEEYSFFGYIETLVSASYTIESLTGRKWGYDLASVSSTVLNPYDENYFDLMTYFRHMGFPSPLLDWSNSLYIALYFAYIDSNLEEDVAIYVYIDWVGGSKVIKPNSPHIHRYNRYVKTHERHYRQQSDYTLCLVQKSDSEFYLTDHKLVLNEENQLILPDSQDIIFKYVLPGKIKKDVLGYLDEMNINHYTLFGDETSLIKYLAYKEIR